MSRELKLAGHYAGRYWVWYLFGLISLTAVDFLTVEVPKITAAIIDGLKADAITIDVITGLLWKMLLFAATTCSATWRHCRRGISTNTRPAI